MLAGDFRLDPLDGAPVPNLAQQWAAGDFSAALDWAGSLPPGGLRDGVYSQLVYERARRDARAASELVLEMRPDVEAREEAAATVLHFWGAQNPGATAPGPPFRSDRSTDKSCKRFACGAGWWCFYVHAAPVRPRWLALNTSLLIYRSVARAVS